MTCGCGFWSVCPAGPSNGGGACIGKATVAMHTRSGNTGVYSKFCEWCAQWAASAGWERDDGLPQSNEEGGS